uniref:Gypsy retrotransposon integrase-like protein 1 n=1 Tax=Cyprinus carpio TaxID=7962 RepID=A0A8C1PHS1_CYPCA
PKDPSHHLLAHSYINQRVTEIPGFRKLLSLVHKPVQYDNSPVNITHEGEAKDPSLDSRSGTCFPDIEDRLHHCSPAPASRSRKEVHCRGGCLKDRRRSHLVTVPRELIQTHALCLLFPKIIAERNYDIGNRELLAVKLALEEWRHWLEGARHPFLVLTDHKNLQYLKEAKRLIPRQARWALFFTRFHFQIFYRPGSKNTRADTLSHLHAPEEDIEEPETILPTKLVVSPIQWDLDDQIQELSQNMPVPPECPADKTYVPEDLRTSLISSAHSSVGTSHPGISKTYSTLQQKYWWPRMQDDVKTFVQGCTLCAITKVPRQLPTGKLVPLPIPHRPWTHVGVDFVTDLPVSDGNTCILIAIDRFSKACKLIPLKALPTAFDTAELLFEHVFRNFGIPEEIVSDRGPQFISRVWRSFFTLSVTVSLTSGYHPQTNGQTERKIQDISRFLRTFSHSNQNLWSRYLAWGEYAQNSLR